jgi:hypothetical protein
MITPVAFSNIGYQTYIIFAVINAFMAPCVYLFYPETAYRSLEEMDAIFHRVGGDGWRGWFTVVQAARDEPRRYGKHGELLIDYLDTEEHKKHATAEHHEEVQRDGGSATTTPSDLEGARGGIWAGEPKN